MGLLKKKEKVIDYSEFCANCVTAFHNKAMELGVAKKGVINIPELDPVGHEAAKFLLSDDHYFNLFGKNIAQYFYVIFSMSIFAGVADGCKWFENYQEFRKGYAKNILLDGPALEGNKVLEKLFPEEIYENQANGFFSALYPTLLKIVEPYLSSKEPNGYIYHSMAAAFQLGVSMVMDKLDYQQ